MLAKKKFSICLMFATATLLFLLFTSTSFADTDPNASGNDDTSVVSLDSSSVSGKAPSTPGESSPTVDPSDPQDPPQESATLEYTSHVQREGWQDSCAEGEVSGTTGQGLRMEALVINLATEGIDGDVQYRTHVQNKGWMKWVNGGETAGTTGQSLRLEAVQIKLLGDIALKYDIYYRVHSQSFGWMEWVKNGAIAGTSGFGRRAEAIEIKLFPIDQGPELAEQKNVYRFDGKNIYYNNSTGATQKGWYKTPTTSRYFDPSTGAMTRGWKTVSNKKYYFIPSTGTMARGVTQIGSNIYFFDANGQISHGWKTANGAKYYFDNKTGLAYKGWHQIGSGLYMFNQSSGKMLANTRYRNLYFPASGNLGSVYAGAWRWLNGNGWSLSKAFNYAAATRYSNSPNYPTSLDYAYHGYANRSGDCYVMAAEFYVMAKLLGYDAYHVYGKVYRYDHSWVEIKQGGKIYVYDPQFTSQEGLNGFQIYYGKPGTWRYTKYGNVRER